MDEVKIWALDTNTAVPLESKGQMDTEWSLEDTLVKNSGLLMPGLTLVGRQTPTEGGPLDLLGVDSDGRLAVFELKRGTLSRDAVAQIIDYASDLDRMELGALAEHISERSGEYDITKIDDFEEWYNQQFPGQGLATLKPPRMFLVGLGADDTTERMVGFLANNSNMDISLLTFHGFVHNGKTLLAKQVQVEGAEDSNSAPSSGYLSATERRERLKVQLEAYGVSELFTAVRDMFKEQWRGRRENEGTTAIGLGLLDHVGSGGRRQRAYARIDPLPGRVQITFYRNAVDLCPDEFDRVKQQITSDIWRAPSDPEGRWEHLNFPLGSDEWETHKNELTSLTRAVYEAWLIKDQGENPSSSSDSPNPVAQVEPAPHD